MKIFEYRNIIINMDATKEYHTLHNKKAYYNKTIAKLQKELQGESQDKRKALLQNKIQNLQMRLDITQQDLIALRNKTPQEEIISNIEIKITTNPFLIRFNDILPEVSGVRIFTNPSLKLDCLALKAKANIKTLTFKVVSTKIKWEYKTNDEGDLVLQNKNKWLTFRNEKTEYESYLYLNCFINDELYPCDITEFNNSCEGTISFEVKARIN